MTINELITYLNEMPSSGFAVHCYDEDDDFSDDDDETIGCGRGGARGRRKTLGEKVEGAGRCGKVPEMH